MKYPNWNSIEVIQGHAGREAAPETEAEWGLGGHLADLMISWNSC